MSLFEQMTTFEHLYQAFLRARKGKRGQEEIAAFERNLEPNLFDIQESLLDQTYQPGGYRSFYLTEAKRRLISAAPFRPLPTSPKYDCRASNLGEGHGKYG